MLTIVSSKNLCKYKGYFGNYIMFLENLTFFPGVPYKKRNFLTFSHVSNFFMLKKIVFFIFPNLKKERNVYF